MKRWQMVLGILVALAASALVARWRDLPWVTERELTGCEQNLKQIFGALEHYRSDHDHYPTQRDGTGATDAQALRQGLVPAYLPEIPSCPRAGRDTYSESFRTPGLRPELSCTGGHPGLAPGYPQTLGDGLVTRGPGKDF